MSLSKLPWNKLTPSRKALRTTALKVLSFMRDGKTLSGSSKDIGININTAIRHLDSAIYKRGGQWVAKKSDSIQRGLVIYEKGEIRSVVVKDSNNASKVGRYFNSIKEFLRTGDSNLLEEYKRIWVVDKDNKRHRLETDPDKIFKIEEMKEDPERFVIYDR